MNKEKESLILLEDILKELESPKGSLLSAVQKLSRVASLLNNDEIHKWCEIQLGNKEYTLPLKEYIDTLLNNQEDKSDDTIQKLEVAKKRLRELGIHSKLHCSIEDLNSQYLIDKGEFNNIGFIEERYNDLVRLKKGNDGTYYKIDLNSHINYVKRKAHQITTKLYTEIKFSGTVSNCFEILKNNIDDKLLDLNPTIAEQLMLAFKSVSSSKEEEWSHALTSCRRLLEGLADELFPAQKETTNGRSLGQNNYINRLWAFMDASIESKSNQELAKAHVDLLGNWIEKINKLLNKGVHAEIEQIEAIKTVFHIYLAIADIFEYLKKENKQVEKLNINDASIDQLEALLNIKRDIAKEIFKLKIKEGTLNIKMIESISGIGKKTIEKIKQEFIIEE